MVGLPTWMNYTTSTTGRSGRRVEERPAVSSAAQDASNSVTGTATHRKSGGRVTATYRQRTL